MSARQFIVACGLGLLALVAGATGKSVLIDVRTPGEYAEGHLSGAINIDSASIAQQISKAGVAKDDELVLYCRSGRRSAAAAETLKGLGYLKVKDLGGIEEARKKLAR